MLMNILPTPQLLLQLLVHLAGARNPFRLLLGDAQRRQNSLCPPRCGNPGDARRRRLERMEVVVRY